MADAPIKDFVKASLQAGATREETRDVLLQAGWPAEQVQDALADYAELSFVVPVPRPKTHVSARDAFFYLVMFSMLYLSLWYLGSLLFVFVEIALPDITRPNYLDWQRGRIRFGVANLLIAWPLFLFLAARIQRRVLYEPAQRFSAIRKWLTWVTLAIAACVLAGDLISLIYRLLSGELGQRFLLKTLIVALLAGGCFAYYFWQMAQDDSELQKGERP